MSRAGRAGLVGVTVAVVLSLHPAGTGAAVSPLQVETTVPTVATTATAPSASSTAVQEQGDADADADAGSTTVVGDPVADRRIRRIVIALCAVAAGVLIVTVLFWRATRPVPRALQGLQALGSRSGRRRAAAAVAADASAEPVAQPVEPALVPASSTTSLPDDG
jgi:hypothetical protein